jgi:hypothetical protein
MDQDQAAQHDIPWEGATRAMQAFLRKRSREGRGLTKEEVDELLGVLERELKGDKPDL